MSIDSTKDSASAAARVERVIGKIIDGKIVWEKPAKSPEEVEAERAAAIEAAAMATARTTVVKRPKRPKVAKPKPTIVFEVNLTEALVGWKAWEVVDGFLTSTVRENVVWHPDQPLVAKCENRAHKGAAPHPHCGCGIYAADSYHNITEFEGPEAVAGEVLGWGRYIRGEFGWRAEYVYPSKLLINRDSMHLIPVLMKYHVPIYCWTPQRIYDPTEDGYGHWKNEENWDFRTAPGSHAEED